MLQIDENRHHRPDLSTPQSPPQLDSKPPNSKPPNSKPWYQSKMVWFNAAVAAVGIATTATPYVQPFVSTETFGLVTAGIGFANAVLRFITNKSLATGQMTGQMMGDGRE